MDSSEGGHSAIFGKGSSYQASKTQRRKTFKDTIRLLETSSAPPSDLASKVTASLVKDTNGLGPTCRGLRIIEKALEPLGYTPRASVDRLDKEAVRAERARNHGRAGQ